MELTAGALNAFEIIVERASTDKEKQFLYRMRKDLNISDRDPVWQICMMNEAFLVRLLEISGAINSAGISNVAAINKMAELAQNDVDASAKKAVSNEMATAKSEMHKAAVSAFSDLAEEAKKVVVKAGQDIAEVDKENAKSQVVREHTVLLQHYAVIGAALVVAAALGGAGAMYGAMSAKLYGAKQDVQAADARAIAANAAAASATANAAASADAAAEAATKKIASEIARVRESAKWAGTKDGLLVSSCNVKGWRVESYTDGSKMCVTNEAVKSLLGKEMPQVGFWLPTSKK